FVGVFHPTHSAIHKRLEILHAVKDSLEVHPVLSPLSDIRSHLYPYRVGGQDAPLPVNPLLAELQPIPGYGLPTNFPEEPIFSSTGSTSPTPPLKKPCTIPAPCGSSSVSTWARSLCQTRPRSASSVT